MQVVIVCDFAVANGGAAKVAIDSALALAAAGVSVRFVHAVAERDPRLEAAGIACTSLDLIDVWNRPPLAAARAGIWNRDAARALRDIFRDGCVPGRSIVHIHQWTRAFSPSAIGAALATDAPVAITAHDYFLACPNGVYYRFERQLPCTVTPLSAACVTARCDPRSAAHKTIRVLRSGATAAALRRRPCDVVHVSDRGRDTLAPLLPPSVRHHRIDNPVDTPRGAAANIGPDAPFAFIGRLTREKGAVIAAAAAQRAGVPIVMIGEGPAEAEIRQANPAAAFTGWQSNAWVAAHQASGAVRAVIAPSLWFETGPLTVYEAAAVGVPSIASIRCGAAERVQHGTSGLVVEPAIEVLAAAMRQLDVETARRYGAAAYARYWSDPPSATAHAVRTIALYEGMLKRT